MGITVAATEYEARILEDYFLEQLIYDEVPGALRSRPYGVPNCLDGNDRREVYAVCGCRAFYVYGHSADELPGHRDCSPQNFLYRCDGYRSEVAEDAGFVACDTHALRAAQFMADWWADDLSDLIDA